MLFFISTGLFWSLRFDLKTRLILVSTKPTPHARHVVCEPIKVNIDRGTNTEQSSQVDSSQQHSNQSNSTSSIEYAVTGMYSAVF